MFLICKQREKHIWTCFIFIIMYIYMFLYTKFLFVYFSSFELTDFLRAFKQINKLRKIEIRPCERYQSLCVFLAARKGVFICEDLEEEKEITQGFELAARDRDCDFF